MTLGTIEVSTNVLEGAARRITRETLEQRKLVFNNAKTRVQRQKERKLALQNKLLFISAQNRIGKFNKIMTNLFRKGKIYRANIDKRDLLLYGPAYRKAIEKEATKAREAGNESLAQSIESEADSRRLSATIRLEDQIKKGLKASAPIGPRTKEAIDKAAKEAGKKPLSSAEANSLISSNLSLNNESDAKSENVGDKVIYWFYYGDLLEEAFGLNNVAQKMRDDNIVPTLGSFLLQDPSTFPIVENLISIPDVPITVDSFLDFFKENVINPGRDVYACQDFIRDTVQRLVTPAINARAFGNEQRQVKTLKVSEFQLPAKKSGGQYYEPLTVGFSEALDRLLSGPSTSPFAGGRVELDDIVAKLSKSKLAKSPVKGIYSYILFYATDSSAQVPWNGDIKEDIKRGIYHHYIGADRGLVKSVNFAKDQRPYVAEMQAERAMKAGDKYAELWRNFKATIDMVGNSLYFPGQYLYINPTVAGLGNPKFENSLSRKLGLGGYYLVLNVSNSIQGGQWSTTVEAQWQSSPPA